MRSLFLTLIFSLSLVNIAQAKTKKDITLINSGNEVSTYERIPGRLLGKGSQLLGVRAGQFGAWGGSLSAGANYEYMYSPEFGFGGQALYSSYKTGIVVSNLTAEMKSRAITIAALGNWHPTFVKVRNFDPYLSLGVAHSFVSSEAAFTTASSMPFPSNMQLKGDSTFLVGSLNARYFLDQHLSAVGSVSLGLSTLSIGMDYLF